ncbi:MAG: (2Fe-2S)-binding protein [Ardenticatenales bacterium]|nr:(2Fe-2S)-binding protein [Ardenticatenales bacterium]
MSTITINETSQSFAPETRLVQAIEQMGIEIGHRCGGQAKCTTCRVVFVEGEPATMTRAEFTQLHNRELFGDYRLSCQILCDHDMTVEPQMTLESEGWSDTGPAVADVVQPDAEWYTVAQLAQSVEDAGGED